MYKVKFSKIATQDLNDAFSYISEVLKNPVAAENLVLETERKTKAIQEFPYSCSLVSDKYLRQLEIRFLLVNNYVGFFQIDELRKEISIVRLLYGRREWKEILKESKER